MQIRDLMADQIFILQSEISPTLLSLCGLEPTQLFSKAPSIHVLTAVLVVGLMEN